MNRGFSILEVLIALSILSTTIIAVTLLTLGMPSMLANARTHAQGTLLASQGFSQEIARGAEGFSIKNLPGPVIVDQFHTSISKDLFGDGEAAKITSSAFWETEWGQGRASEVKGIITDYMHAKDYACSPFLFGKWESPITQEVPYSFPQLTSIAASRTRIIAIASSTPGFNDASLFVFNIEAEKTLPAFSSSFDIATSSKVGYIAAVLSQDTLYTLSAHTCTSAECASLDIFSLSTESVMKGKSVSLPPARSITYQDGYLYIGLRGSALSPEFLIYDVSSPLLPIRVGSAEIGDTINDILVRDAKAYIATTDNSVAGNKALMVFDVSNPYEEMTPLARSRQAGAGISQKLTISGEILYLGRSSPLNSKELYSFSTNNIQTSISVHDTDSSIAGIIVRGFELFVLTRTRIDRMNIEDEHNPFADSTPLATGTSGVALACAGARMFVATNDTRGHLLLLSGL